MVCFKQDALYDPVSLLVVPYFYVKASSPVFITDISWMMMMMMMMVDSGAHPFCMLI